MAADAGRYAVLKRMADSRMVLLNHAVAAAMVNGPQQKDCGWIDELVAGGSAARHHRLHAVRGHLLEMAEQ